MPRLDSSSSGLSADAERSFAELRAQARVLGSYAASLRREAADVTAAYQHALREGSEEAWSAFVRASEALASHGGSAVALLRLGEKERQAAQFFARIAAEKAELLPATVFA